MRAVAESRTSQGATLEGGWKALLQLAGVRILSAFQAAAAARHARWPSSWSAWNGEGNDVGEQMCCSLESVFMAKNGKRFNCVVRARVYECARALMRAKTRHLEQPHACILCVNVRNSYKFSRLAKRVGRNITVLGSYVRVQSYPGTHFTFDFGA